MRVRTGRVFGVCGVVGWGLAAWGQCPDIPVNPGADTKGAGFGSSVAISADGTIALVGGPGFDFGDGVVRSFDRVGDGWVEGTAFDGVAFVGEGFGSSICMSDDGRWAVITAPSETHFDPAFLFGAGAVYLHERDEGTGEWSLVERWVSPNPGTNEYFGQSCAISPDGNTVVIGEAFNQAGDDTAPDEVWVIDRVGGVWGTFEQLIPDAPVDFELNFGLSVAISDDATLIAASAPDAPAFTPGATGQVYIFEKIAGAWTHTDTLERPEKGASFNGFGRVITFDGDTLLAVNPNESTPGPEGEPAPPICVFNRAGGAYPAEPDALLYGILEDGPIVISGDTMLVRGPQEFPLISEMHEFERTMDGWRFVDRFLSDDPQDFTCYGRAIAMSGDGAQRIIGEPCWDEDGVFDVGRIHFPDRVFQQTPFTIDSATSSFSFEVTFMGIPLQQIILQMLGLLDIDHPESCDGGLPTSASLMCGELVPVDGSITIDGPMGMDLTFSEVVFELEAPTAPVPVDASGNLVIDDVVMRVSAMRQLGAMTPKAFETSVEYPPIHATLTDKGDGTMRFEVPNFSWTGEFEFGLGKDNPQVSVQMSIMADEPEACPADLAPPFGVLDFDDVLAFLTAFGAMDAAADLAEPFGEIDFDDVLAFLVSFGSGCP